MSIPSELLSQCLDLAKQFITLNQKASINVRLGSDFVFSFNNQENISERKKSPSQIKRNFERKETFNNMKKETIETNANTLEKKPETKDSETQIDILVTSTGTNTDTKNVDDSNDNKQDDKKNTDTKNDNDCSDDKEDFNENKEIRPKEKETILEMRINHEDLDKQKVKTFISKSLMVSLIGEPWIANNGRHFATVGFKTWTSDYEKWKEDSVNWRESGIREVYFSRLYQQ